MNKIFKRPPFLITFITGAIGGVIGIGIAKMTEDHHKEFKNNLMQYLNWVKSEGIYLLICYVFWVSLYYLIIRLYDKRHQKKNHDA